MAFQKVSIQIPTYNQAVYIEKAIKNCLQQDYSDIEINIADDCSTDNTYEVVKKYLSDSRIRYFKNEKNIGRVANYRKALYEYASGDWALNLDGDDYFTNNGYIKNAIEKIGAEGYNNVLFYQGAHVFKTSVREHLVEARIIPNMIMVSAKNYLEDFFAFSHFSHMSTLYNRKAAINSGFYEKDILSADIYSFLKLAVNNPEKEIILTKEVSGVWFQHEKNISKSPPIGRHIKNFGLYTDIFLRQLKSSDFSKLSPCTWFSKAVLYYWWAWYLKKIQ